MADSEHQSFTHVTAIEMAVAASTMVGTLHRFNCNSTMTTLYTGNGKMKGRWKDCQRSWKTIFLLIRLNIVPWFSAHFYVDRKHFEAGSVFCWMWVRYPLLGILSRSSGDAVLQLQSAHTAFSQAHCSLCWADEQYEESSPMLAICNSVPRLWCYQWKGGQGCAQAAMGETEREQWLG